MIWFGVPLERGVRLEQLGVDADRHDEELLGADAVGPTDVVEAVLGNGDDPVETLSDP